MVNPRLGGTGILLDAYTRVGTVRSIWIGSTLFSRRAIVHLCILDGKYSNICKTCVRLSCYSPVV